MAKSSWPVGCSKKDFQNEDEISEMNFAAPSLSAMAADFYNGYMSW